MRHIRRVRRWSIGFPRSGIQESPGSDAQVGANKSAATKDKTALDGKDGGDLSHLLVGLDHGSPSDVTFCA